jgi:hypothetical protein
MLNWKTVNLKNDYGGLLPFFIEWSTDSVHPSVDAPKGCALGSFTAISPTKDLWSMAEVLGLDLHISEGKETLLQAVIIGREDGVILTSPKHTLSDY